MTVHTENGCTIWFPQSGGSAGKNRNVTGSLQVRRGGQILKNFRYTRDTQGDGYRKAFQKALTFLRAHTTTYEQ